MILTDVLIAAVQDGFVAPRILADSGERLDNPQTELATLHALVNCDVLDMTNPSKVASELLLQEDGANANNSVCLAQNDDEGVVGVGT